MTRENRRAKIYSWQPTAHQQLDKVYWQFLKYHQNPLWKACIDRSTGEIVQQNYEQTEFEESRPPSKVILKWTEFQRRNRWQQCSRFEQCIRRRAISLAYALYMFGLKRLWLPRFWWLYGCDCLQKENRLSTKLGCSCGEVG